MRDVGAAVDRFLDGVDLDPAQEIDAAAARALAAKLDQAGTSDTASAGATAPAIARELLGIIRELRGDARESDGVDEIRERREARLLAKAAGSGS